MLLLIKAFQFLKVKPSVSFKGKGWHRASKALGITRKPGATGKAFIGGIRNWRVKDYQPSFGQHACLVNFGGGCKSC